MTKKEVLDCLEVILLCPQVPRTQCAKLEQLPSFQGATRCSAAGIPQQPALVWDLGKHDRTCCFIVNSSLKNWGGFSHRLKFKTLIGRGGTYTSWLHFRLLRPGCPSGADTICILHGCVLSCAFPCRLQDQNLILQVGTNSHLSGMTEFR